MTTLTEIEAAIKQLSQDDACKLADWLQRYVDDAWDKQIEEDFKLGKLDKLISQAEVDISAGDVRCLNKSLHRV